MVTHVNTFCIKSTLMLLLYKMSCLILAGFKNIVILYNNLHVWWEKKSPLIRMTYDRNMYHIQRKKLGRWWMFWNELGSQKL